METPKDNELEIPKKIDRYELVEKIGSGGMGVIFKGFDTRLKRPVAIKIVSDRVKDPEIRANIRERFFNEARAAGGLSHPNLVQIYDFGDFDGFATIIMEFIQGETLEALLKARTQLNTEEILRYGREVVSALAFAHKKGIVHRDVKPSNIIIEAASGVTKVLDFGIAKFVNEEEMKLTSTGMVLGSTHYLSPEHIIGKNLDGRSDLFCLGTVLYEAATGQLPFRGSNSSSILYKIVHFDPQPVVELRPDIPLEVSNLIMKCLKKNINERYQSGEELEKEIQGIQSSYLKTSRKTDIRSISDSIFKSYYVRDSQLLVALQSQNRIDKTTIGRLKGKNIADSLLKEDLLSEDELSKMVADCLDLPWISRGRLRSLKISDEAFQLLHYEILIKNNILPFFFDEAQKTVSFVIDGTSDFQKESGLAELFSKYQPQFYVSGKYSIRRLIESKKELKISHTTGQTNISRALDKLQIQDTESQKRVLLVEKDPAVKDGLIKFFKKRENSLAIVSDGTEGLSKLKKEAFDIIWISRDCVGDELDFENTAIRHHPSVILRFYDDLSREVFEESINYSEFREFFQRLVSTFLGRADEKTRKLASDSAQFALRLGRLVTDNLRILDEIYFSALFFYLERITEKPSKAIDLFDGVCRLRPIFDSLDERFDGRGPLGLKERQIPVGARILQTISLLNEDFDFTRQLTEEEFQKVKSKINRLLGKQIDPEIGGFALDLLKPEATSSQKISSIAIIDSDSVYAQKLVAQLLQIPARAIVYSDGVAALNGLKKDKPDLIISEIMVSKLDGLSLCARIRADALLKSIPLVFLSESTSSDHSTKALQLGADDYIAKSSDSSFILTKIEKALRRA